MPPQIELGVHDLKGGPSVFSAGAQRYQAAIPSCDWRKMGEAKAKKRAFLQQHRREKGKQAPWKIKSKKASFSNF
jgi:hypothetical protein